MDTLDAMRIFVRVTEAGSFSTVAMQMGVARSIITRQVAALETRLGTKLLARSTRRMSVTTAGASYLEKCRVILNLVEVAETGLAQERIAPRGQIRLSLPLLYGQRFLVPLLFEFVKLYPEVELDMNFSDQHSNLVQEGIDMAVRITARLSQTDVVRKLGQDDVVLVAAPSYLALHGSPSHPNELLHHQCLAYTGIPKPNHWSFKINGKIEEFPIRSQLQTNNGEVLLQAAAQGFGIAYEPRHNAQAWIERGQLTEIALPVEPLLLGIYALLPSNRHLPHRLRVLIDFLAQRLPSQTPNPNPEVPKASVNAAPANSRPAKAPTKQPAAKPRTNPSPRKQSR